MKKKSVIPIIYFILLIAYVSVSLLLDIQRETNYWIGFGFVIFSLIMSMLITLEGNNPKESTFPISISTIVFSFIYVACTLLISFCFGGINEFGEQIIKTNNFLIIEIVCLVIYIIVLVLLYVVNNHTSAVNKKTDFELNKKERIIFRLKNAMSKTLEFDNSKDIKKVFDSIFEDIKYSNFSIDADTSTIDYEISILLDRLDADIQNIININSNDYSSVINTLNSVKGKIKERNELINISNNHI